MPLRLIIFDLDGTLVDSSVDITNALNYAVEPYAFKKLTVRDTISMVGEGITRLIEKLPGIAGEEMKKDVIDRFLYHYSSHILDFTTAYPGVKETLVQLGGYKKAVISNKREVLSRAVLDGLSLSRYFDVIIGSDTTPERKPSPVPVFRVLEVLGVGTAEAAMVGDSNLDIDAGKAAGVTTIAVTYGYRPKEMIMHADFMIDSMQELLPLVARLSA